MHSYHVDVGWVIDTIQRIFNAVPAGLTTRHDMMRNSKTILLTQGVPQLHLAFRKGDNYIKRTVPIFPKGADGAHEDGDAAQFQELLGHLGTKSGTTSPCYNNRYRLHNNSVLSTTKLVKKFDPRQNLKRNLKPQLKIPF